MKKVYIYIIIAIILIALFFVIRGKIEPKFSIETYDKVSGEGKFSFGGHLGTFSVHGGGSASAGRNGYIATYGVEGDKFVFKLYKDGKFIKVLEKLDLPNKK